MPFDPARRRPDWRRTAAEQDRVLARWQALEGGLSPDAWDWRLGRSWTSPVPGVAVLHSGAISEREAGWAAVLTCGPGASLSGDAGLRERGMKRIPEGAFDVAISRTRTAVEAKLNSGRLVKPHRLSRPERWQAVQDGLPVLSMHACVLHAAAWASSDRWAEHRLASAVQQRLTAVPLLRATLAQMPKLARRELVLTVLDDVELGAHATSELEFLRFCRRNGLPEPDELQVRVRAGGTTRFLDGRYRRQRISVEVDGGYHLLVEAWDADALRTLELAVAQRGSGDQLIRITQSNLRHDEPTVARLLRTLLEC